MTDTKPCKDTSKTSEPSAMYEIALDELDQVAGGIAVKTELALASTASTGSDTAPVKGW